MNLSHEFIILIFIIVTTPVFSKQIHLTDSKTEISEKSSVIKETQSQSLASNQTQNPVSKPKQLPQITKLNLDQGFPKSSVQTENNSHKLNISVLSKNNKAYYTERQIKDFDEDVLATLSESKKKQHEKIESDFEASLFEKKLSKIDDKSEISQISKNSSYSSSLEESFQSSEIPKTNFDLIRNKLKASGIPISKPNQNNKNKQSRPRPTNNTINRTFNRPKPNIQKVYEEEKLKQAAEKNKMAMSSNSIDNMIRDIKGLQGDDLEDEIAFLLSRERLNYGIFQQEDSDTQVKTVLLIAKFFKDRKGNEKKELRSLIGEMRCNLRHEEVENVVDATMTKRIGVQQQKKKTKVKK